MGGEQGLGPDLAFVTDVLEDGLRDGHTVEGGRAAADLIEDDEALAGRVLQDGGHLVHLDHEGGLSGREVIGGADSREDGVADGDAGGGGRDEAAHLCHQHDEGDLSHVGRFTGHVRTGDDGGLGVVEVECRVIRDEGRAVQQLLDHRVAAVLDDDAAVLRDLGAHIPVVHRHFGKGAEDVEGGHRVGGLLDADEALGDGLPHAAEQFIFEFRDPFLGTQDFGFEFFQFAGDVPLGIREGLLADPFLRYVALERTGHFEVVAEDLVVADLQFRDAGAFPLLGFDGGEVPLTVRDDVAEFIEFGTVALFDHAAFPDREGRVFGDGLLDEGHDVFQGVDVRLDALHEAGLCALQKQFDGQQALYGLIEAAQLSRVRRAVGDAGDEPFHIVDGSHVLGDLIAQGEV